MRGIYKKPFAESFPRNLPMEDFAVPSRRLAVPNPEGICGLGPKACGLENFKEILAVFEHHAHLC